MTDEQIIKAFEEILKNQNNKLSLIERAVCDDVLSLANRQKAKIEELRERVAYLEKSIDYSRKEYNQLLQKLQQAKSEAIKQFAERLKDDMLLDEECKYNCISCCYECKEYVPLVDNLVEEMTEEEK